MLAEFIACQQQMQRCGVRRILTISGEATWCRQQAEMLSQTLMGDWLWVGYAAHEKANVTLPSAAKTLLGQEFRHAVFDATSGFDVEALAALAGALCAGSWLLLLVPDWDAWSLRPDEDSLRWSEQSAAIATPHFIDWFRQHLLADAEAALWRQGDPPYFPPLKVRPNWQPPQGEPTAEQQRLLTQLINAKSGVWVVTAARGRGKSTLAGMLVENTEGRCWLTSPNKKSSERVNLQAHDRAEFFAPDALLERCRRQVPSDVAWLLIDEAAAIPTPLLTELIHYFPRTLLTTTVQGYEGTGRGFLLKFCSSLAEWYDLRLTDPIRWASDDPLERLLDRALLLSEPEDQPVLPPGAEREIVSLPQSDWLNCPELLGDFYGLLSSAHYRTSPLDLRRMLDAPGMHFSAALTQRRLQGALWLVDEGGLDRTLAHDVWAGRRRPRGNLVAQSLAAHGGQWWAPTLRSRRISRIAVHESARRQGMARSLIDQQKKIALQQGQDFLSVSFGYTPALWQFWFACGFSLVRIGTHREASSGCYSVMAALPLSEAGRQLAQSAYTQLQRDWPWLQERLDIDIPIIASMQQQLNDEDWQALAGFAFAHRSIEASLGALQRLFSEMKVLQGKSAAPMLSEYLHNPTDIASCITRFGLSGRKALLQAWRNEAAAAMKACDPQATARWRAWCHVLPSPTQQ